jgi:hypothetical protein
MGKLKKKLPSSASQPDLLNTEITASMRSTDGSYGSANANIHFAEMGTTPSLTAAVDVDDFCCDGSATSGTGPDTIKIFCHLRSRRLFDVQLPSDDERDDNVIVESEAAFVVWENSKKSFRHLRRSLIC